MSISVEVWTMKGLTPEGAPRMVEFAWLPRIGERVVLDGAEQGRLVEQIEHRQGSIRLYLQESSGMEKVGGDYPG